MSGLVANKGFTLKNPDGTYRIPAEKADEFRMLQAGGRIALFGAHINALGEWESLGMTVEEVKLLLRKYADIKKR
jgi:hypothetical protein